MSNQPTTTAQSTIPMNTLAAIVLGAILGAATTTGIAAAFGPGKPAEYRVIASRTASQLGVEVSKALADGWVPLGHAAATSDSEIMQTMLKY